MSLITVATIVVVMTTLATIFPQIFERMGRGLFVSLILGIVMELVSMLLGYGGQLFDKMATQTPML